MVNRLHIISLSAVGSMSLVAAMIQPPNSPEVKPAQAEQAEDRVMRAGNEVTLRADGSGQFHIEALINGAPTKFLVDTGANMVALTEDEAAQLGLNLMPDDFQANMQTASGTGYGAPVRLDRIEIAGVILHDVDAVVVKDLGINLMGQSVLRQLGSVEMKGDTMVLKPR